MIIAMAWDSRIKSEKTRRIVIGGVMLVLLGLSTASAVLMTRHRNPRYEDKDATFVKMGDFAMQLPNVFVKVDGDAGLAPVKGVKMKTLGVYQRTHRNRNEYSFHHPLTIVSLSFDHPVQIGIAHKHLQAQFSIQNKLLNGPYSFKGVMPGYESYGRYVGLDSYGDARSYFYRFATMTRDNQHFVGVVYVAEQLDRMAFETLIATAEDMRYEAVPYDKEKGEVIYGGLRMPVIDGVMPIVKRQAAGDKKRELIFTSDGRVEPFVMRVLPLSINSTGKVVSGEKTKEDVLRELDGLLKNMDVSFFENPSEQKKWTPRMIGNKTVATLEVKTWMKQGIVQRFYVVALNDKRGVIIKVESPLHLIKSMSSLVTKMIMGMEVVGEVRGDAEGAGGENEGVGLEVEELVK